LGLKRSKKGFNFYNILDAQAEAAHRAAQAFHALSTDFAHLGDHVQQIAQIEREGDELTHQLANKLDATFVTPLDKEDLRAISGALDDVTDMIEAGAQRIILYRLMEPRPDLAPLAGLLVQIAEATKTVVAGLRHRRTRMELHERLIRIHALENESDIAYRQALADLFNAENPDPLMVIKWKEIYDRVETTTDKCEDVANIVESVVVKYA
jgi:uncharacterized protein